MIAELEVWGFSSHLWQVFIPLAMVDPMQELEHKVTGSLEIVERRGREKLPSNFRTVRVQGPKLDLCILT